MRTVCAQKLGRQRGKLQRCGRLHAAHHQLRVATAQRRQAREVAVAKVLLEAEAS